VSVFIDDEAAMTFLHHGGRLLGGLGLTAPPRFTWIGFFALALAGGPSIASAVELPRHYFDILEVIAPERLAFRFAITETGRGRLQDARLNLQLCLKAGAALETARTKIVLGEKRLELGPEESGGWIRHRGWTLRVDPAARLVWPVRGFNPYRNGPEPELRHAVGGLTVPVRVQPPTEGALNWRRLNIAFVLEVKQGRQAPEVEGCEGAAQPRAELARIAAAMKPGTWAELKTQGYTARLLKVQNHHILEYTGAAAWDPTSQQVLFVGQGHYSALRFIAYDAATNAWKQRPTPPWWKGDPETGKGPIGHAYYNNTIDPSRGIFYMHQSATRLVHRYDVARDEWTTLPEIKGATTGHGTAIAYFPERRGLVRVHGGAVHFFSEAKGEWTKLADRLPMGPYHHVAQYSAPHKVVLFGGGNNSKALYRLDAAGKITPLKPAPVEIGINTAVVSSDPGSGEVLVLHKDDRLWSCNPVADTWTELSTEGMPFRMKGSPFDVVATPLASHGVTLFFTAERKGLKVCLYRHSSPRN
jgi:hypothetical protein